MKNELIVASVSGHIGNINLAYIDAIYKDRHKDGYWIRFLEPCSYTGEIQTIKLYYVGLTRDQRSVIMAAVRLNQLMRIINREQEKTNG